jgi:hypothetical protein
MKTIHLVALSTALLGSLAFAQTPTAPAAVAPAVTHEAERDVKQQQRIEQGLQSGQLSTHEAARLEHDEAKVDTAQANALKDGKLTRAERKHIGAMQDRTSGAIAAEKHDAQTGNPQSRSSRRMQADVQRNANQEQRIANGAATGALTKHEAARLERGEARLDNGAAAAGADGHVGAREQHALNRADNAESRRIHRKKHNARASA